MIKEEPRSSWNNSMDNNTAGCVGQARGVDRGNLPLHGVVGGAGDKARRLFSIRDQH